MNAHGYRDWRGNDWGRQRNIVRRCWRIGKPAMLEERGETLLDCADGKAWLAALMARALPR